MFMEISEYLSFTVYNFNLMSINVHRPVFPSSPKLNFSTTPCSSSSMQSISGHCCSTVHSARKNYSVEAHCSVSPYSQCNSSSSHSAKQVNSALHLIGMQGGAAKKGGGDFTMRVHKTIWFQVTPTDESPCKGQFGVKLHPQKGPTLQTKR